MKLHSQHYRKVNQPRWEPCWLWHVRVLLKHTSRSETKYRENAQQTARLSVTQHDVGTKDIKESQYTGVAMEYREETGFKTGFRNRIGKF